MEYEYLPNFAKCAIDRLDCDSTLRSNIKLDEFLDAYAKTYGIDCDNLTRDAAHNICISRFFGSFSIIG